MPAPRAELRGSESVRGAEAAYEPTSGLGADADPDLGPDADLDLGPDADRDSESSPDPGLPTGPGPGPGPGPEPGPELDSATASRHLPPRTGVAALSPRYQVGAALALAVVAVAVCVHVGMVFLHVAPSNTVTKAHGEAIDDWIYPEFEQNWKLFAPNPLQQNIAVQVRAQIRGGDGGSRTTGWYDLSAQDGRNIDGNLVPSHTQQNELRRAWDFFTATHDSSARPVGLRGALAETYLRRIVVMRLERGAVDEGGVVERVQVRSRTTNVPPPKWSTDKVSTSPVYRVLSWWSVPDGATGGGMR
ncbi:DUF5819 family protein [Streptomyces sp. B4I13]|uniref:DUF5819 family protein n=1 Tax=Streptomyces sp. B4I13 TaxID=3042271 RepID=UPI0027D8286A|nr:DUF5819 family protein [Streptomyces sp. B4I13]